MNPKLLALAATALLGALGLYYYETADDEVDDDTSPEPTGDPVPPGWMLEALAPTWPARVRMLREGIAQDGEATAREQYEQMSVRVEDLTASANDDRDRGFVYNMTLQMDALAQLLGLPRPDAPPFQLSPDTLAPDLR